MRPDIDWQSFWACPPNVSCRLFLTPKIIGTALQNIRCPSMVLVGWQAASAQSRLKKAFLHLDELRANLALVDQATTLSTYGC